MRAPPRLLLSSVAWLAPLACALPMGSEAGECEADDECALDERCRAGACRAAAPDAGDPFAQGATRDAGATSDAGPADAAAPPLEGGTDPLDTGATSPLADAGAGETGPLACAGAWDAVLTSEELPLVLDTPLRVWSAGREDAPAAVDLVGAPDEAGVQTWDFSAPRTDDRSWSLTARSLDDTWFGAEFADAFPAATARVPLDDTGELWAVLARDESHLRLLGVASEETGETLLRYDPPVDTLRLPLRVGDAWRTESDVTGTFEGNPFYVSRDIIDVEVRAEGRVQTPAGTYPVLQLRTRTESRVVVPWFPFEQVYPRWQHAFYTACLGQVAYALGPLGDDVANFPTAAELRRVGLP